MSTRFITIDPSIEDYWRSIVMYGRNVATYKFALAKSLLEIKPEEGQLVKLEEIAPCFSKHICEHLKLSDKQTTSKSSRFLDACRGFNDGSISESELIDKTISLGFNNVIDAFHVVGSDSISKPFYVDERNQNNGIRITTEFSDLKNNSQFSNLEHEAEARWNLVETSWRLDISRNLLRVDVNESLEDVVVYDKEIKRTTVTSSRKALNAYQRGGCFYCNNQMIDLSSNSEAIDVDHFFPHKLKQAGFKNIDGVWNLVLSCVDCNRGIKGKSDKLPKIRFLEKLYARNEFLIGSNHPLQKTLRLQTGSNEKLRKNYLNNYYNDALANLIHDWEPE